MIEKLMDKYQITRDGASGLVVAVVFSTLTLISFMLPMMIVMLFSMQILDGSDIGVWVYIASIILSAIIMYVVVNISYKKTYSLTYGESKNMRISLANKLRELPISYYSKRDLTDLSQSIMADVQSIEHCISHAVPQFYAFVVFFIIISVMMISSNLILGLCVVIPISTSLLGYFALRKLQQHFNKKYYDILRRNSDLFQECIEMQEEIKSFNKESVYKKSMYESMEESEKLHIRMEIYAALHVTLSGFMSVVSIAATMIAGAYLYSKGEISILYLIGYVLAASRIYDGANSMHMNLAEINYIKSMTDRLRELNTYPTQKGKDIHANKYDIEFENVGFSYGNHKVMKGVSFVARQGEVTALVGPSGCGKTTALKLASRLYDYDSGSIKIGGIDIKEISTENLFKDISIVFQDVVLFNNTIMENIRIGRKDASDEEVIKAAKMAHCDFIESLPNGYHTMIGENGSKLSGGERQRLSIARAFLKNADIIILDEISASLDIDNEKKIQDSLNKLIKNKTVLIISHRMKSIQNVDNIVVMNDGKVESCGKHKHLLEVSDTYKNMIEKSSITESYVY